MRFWNRRDEDVVEDTAVSSPPTEADLKRAYERGRRDERSRHRGHPVIGLLLAVVALMGVGLVYLAAREGSFSGGGQVIDQKLAVASNDVSQTASRAVAGAGDTVTGAGQRVTGAGERVKQAGQSLDQNSAQQH